MDSHSSAGAGLKPFLKKPEVKKLEKRDQQQSLPAAGTTYSWMAMSHGPDQLLVLLTQHSSAGHWDVLHSLGVCGI